MTDDDLKYILAGVQPADVTEKHLASYQAGFLGFDFVGPRPFPLSPAVCWEINTSNREFKHQNREIREFDRSRLRLKDEFKQEIRARRAARSAENNRLVQGCKTPTRAKDPRIIAKSKALKLSLCGANEIDERGFMSPESLYDSADRGNRTTRKSTIQLLHQDWSGKYRLQHVIDMPPEDAPDVNDGDRYTEKLTPRAVGKIFESAAYVAACHDGFRTFVTLTFDAETRNSIFEQETTLGKEVSRFIDGIKKVYQRGWGGESDDGEWFECEAREDDFHYMWVAECPANEDGEANPHIHLLMDWHVEKHQFSAWAKRLEKVWGRGFAHLERIRNPKGAGNYIIKAVGYAAKGSNANQGLIKGNRYGIAKCSRAPGWQCLDSFEADNMAGIIKECSYKLEQWRKPYERELYKLTKKKDQTIKAMGVMKQSGDKEMLGKLRARLKRIETTYRDTKGEMLSRGVYASTKNKFSLHFDGDDAEIKIYDFLLWAAGARGWSMKPVIGDGCHDIRHVAREHYARQRSAWMEKRMYWQAVLKDPLNQPRAPEHDDEMCAALSRMYLNGAELHPNKPETSYLI